MKQTYHNIGIIGFGARGQQLAQLMFNLMPQYGRIAAVADCDRELVLPADICLNCRHMKRYFSSQELLENPDIDTVIINTYSQTHADIAIAAMESGKAVLCDKPVTDTLDDAARLYSYVTTHPCRFAIGLNLPFYPSSVKIRELLSAGTIGKLLCIRGMCDVGANFGRRVIMRRFVGQKEGMVLGKLTHDSDLMQYLANSYAEEVTGHTANFLWKRHGDDAGSDDTAVMAGVMNNGVLFSLSLTSCGATYGRILECWGEGGMIRADINSERIIVAKTDSPEQVIDLPPQPGSHRGGDRLMMTEFLDYVDSGVEQPLRPERILSSIMIPLAAMQQKTVQTGDWYRKHLNG